MEVQPGMWPTKANRKIAFVTFETELAPCGGLAAVMKILPKKLAERETCFTIGPYFRNVTGKRAEAGQIVDTGVEFVLRFGAESHAVRILKRADVTGYVTYLLDADGYFTAPRDPYFNPGDPGKLLIDSLFFCAAVPRAVVSLGEANDVVFHLQDWETASVAHTCRREPGMGAAACILTLHNPYDKGLSDVQASLISSENLPGNTVLTKMIPLIDGALTTVSRNFAQELVSDRLHTDVFADHLQGLFRSKGIIGIDNGQFGEPLFPFSDEAHVEAERGEFGRIQSEKWERRIALSETIDSYLRVLADDPDRQVWGKSLSLADPSIPVFLFLGRDDPRQKGYDIAAEAIRAISPGRARYIFTPMPGDEGFEGLSFLKTLAEERAGEVMVFPFRLDAEPFMALQRGSSFMAMFSFYEPFGSANEAYIAGMPVVARATGGLVQQIVPHNFAELGRNGQQLVREYHDQSAEPTGFLFRERASESDVTGWRKIIDCRYLLDNPRRERTEDCKGIPLCDEMVVRAGRALEAAIEFYSSDQIGYARMVYNGFLMLSKFSWDRAIAEYTILYDNVCRS